MNKPKNLALLSLFFIFSCGKNDNPSPATAENYMNMKDGSVWNYEVINNVPPSSTSYYSLTSTSRDSTVDAKLYHVFTNSSNGASEYYRVSGSDYSTFQNLPAALGGTKIDNLYLKSGASVGTTWAQSYNITYNSLPLTVTLTNKILETGISKTVNSITYNNVIHVSTGVSVAGIPASALTSDINYYYAPKYGMIESTTIINLNYFGMVSNTNNTTRLKTATLVN